MKRTCLASLIIVAFVSFAFSQTTYAAGSGYWDLRLSLGTYPGAEDVSYSGEDCPEDTSFDSDGKDFELYAVHRFSSGSSHSGYIDFGVFSRSSSGDGDTDYKDKDYKDYDEIIPFNTDLDISMGGLSIGGGYSFKPNDWYSLEVGPRFYLGTAKAEEKYTYKYEELVGVDVSDKIKSDTGVYFAYDLVLRNIFNVTKNFQLGIGLGLAAWAAVVKYDGEFFGEYDLRDKIDWDATYSGAGVFANVFAGVRF